MSDAPKPAPGLSAFRMLVVGLSATFMGELYQDHIVTFLIPDACSVWLDAHFSPPLYGWLIAVLAHFQWRLWEAIGHRAAPLFARLETDAKPWVERIEERLHHHAIVASPAAAAPAPAAPVAEAPPASPVVPILPEAIKHGA